MPDAQICISVGQPLDWRAVKWFASSRLSSTRFAMPYERVAGVERSEPPEAQPAGGSLRSTPGTFGLDLVVLKLNIQQGVSS